MQSSSHCERRFNFRYSKNPITGLIFSAMGRTNSSECRAPKAYSSVAGRLQPRSRLGIFSNRTGTWQRLLDCHRPLTVLDLRGQKLELRLLFFFFDMKQKLRLLNIAEIQEVDEFIVGIPKSGDGKETEQSNKVRSVAGRLAVRAAERGWRVYLQDEHGTTTEAVDHMIAQGLSESARPGNIDAYAAVKVLERYFSDSGYGIELVVPKHVELRNKLRKGPPKDLDFFPEE